MIQVTNTHTRNLSRGVTCPGRRLRCGAVSRLVGVAGVELSIAKCRKTMDPPPTYHQVVGRSGCRPWRSSRDNNVKVVSLPQILTPTSKVRRPAIDLCVAAILRIFAPWPTRSLRPPPPQNFFLELCKLAQFLLVEKISFISMRISFRPDGHGSGRVIFFSTFQHPNHVTVLLHPKITTFSSCDHLLGTPPRGLRRWLKSVLKLSKAGRSDPVLAPRGTIPLELLNGGIFRDLVSWPKSSEKSKSAKIRHFHLRS